MSTLIRELNQAVGSLRAIHEFLSEDSKVLVDNSITGMPIIISKDRLLAIIAQAQVTADKAVCHLSGFPWIQKLDSQSSEQQDFLARRDADDAADFTWR